MRACRCLHVYVGNGHVAPCSTTDRREQLEIPGIVTRLINACWKLFTWCLGLALLVTVAVLGYTYLQLDEELRRRAEELLSQHYAHLNVELGGARFVKGRGVHIYDLRIVRPMIHGHSETLLEVDEALLTCPTDWEDLLRGQLRVQKVSAKRVLLHLVRHDDGSWGAQELWPPPDLGDDPPTVEVTEATLVLGGAGARNSGFTLAGIDLILTPQREAPGPGVEGDARETFYQIVATSTGSWARQFRLEGIAAPGNGYLDLETEVHEMEITPDLVAMIGGLARSTVPTVQLSGLMDGKLQVTRSAQDPKALGLNCAFSLRDGRLVDERLPRPITELNLQGRCDQSECIVELLTGKCGATEVQLACKRAGWSARAPLGLHAKVLGLPLDNALYSVLPEPLRRGWDRFDPAGNVDADLLLTYDGARWAPQLTVECRQVAFADKRHFPYRLEQCVGTVTYKHAAEQPGGELEIGLLGMGQGYPVRVAGALTNLPLSNGPELAGPRESPSGWIEVSANGMFLHDQLINALHPVAQQVVHDLQPEGRFDFRWRGERKAAATELNTLLEITLHDAAIQYTHFPYPLRDITGQLICRNDEWQFVHLQSRSAGRDAAVTAEGSLVPMPDGRRLRLAIEAEDVALDEELRRALSPEIQNVWMQLKPQGRVDLAVSVDHICQADSTARPDIRVTVQPEGDTVSLDPAFLPSPYRLEKVGGQFEYVQGQIKMANVRAQHGRVEISTQGLWQAGADGGWELKFSDFHAVRLTASRDLLLALPARLQKAIDTLRPTGTFSLYNSTFEYIQPADSLRRGVSAWNLNLECQQSDLHAGVQLEDVSGSVRLIGKSDGHQGFTAGELALDSLVWNNVQFTAVRGPLWIDLTPAGSIVYLGRAASVRQQQPGESPRRISARVYGGDVVADVEIRNEGIPRFNLQADLAQADLTQYALERLGGRADVTGTVNGRIQLTNTGTSSDAMTGGGELHLVDANIYRLPQIVALLKVLQIRTPDTTAFNACDSLFSIQGRHLTFQELNLLGDAVSLYGAGESSLDGDHLNLTFKTEMGRRQIPVFSSISSLWGEAQAQFVQLRVAGTVQNPSFHVEPLPGVKKTLEQIQNEFPPVMNADERQAESRFPLWPFR